MSECYRVLPFDVWVYVLEQGDLTVGDLRRFGATCKDADELVRSREMNALALKKLWFKPGQRSCWTEVCRDWAPLVPDSRYRQTLCEAGPCRSQLRVDQGMAIVTNLIRPLASSAFSCRVFDLKTGEVLCDLRFDERDGQFLDAQVVGRRLFVGIEKSGSRHFRVFGLKGAGKNRAGEGGKPLCSALLSPSIESMSSSGIAQNGYFAVAADRQTIELYKYLESKPRASVAVGRSLQMLQATERHLFVSSNDRGSITLSVYSIPKLKRLRRTPLPFHLNGLGCFANEEVFAFIDERECLRCFSTVTGGKLFQRDICPRKIRPERHFLSLRWSLVINPKGTVDLIQGTEAICTLLAPETDYVTADENIAATVSESGVVRLWNLETRSLMATWAMGGPVTSVALKDGQLVVRKRSGEIEVWGRRSVRRKTPGKEATSQRPSASQDQAVEEVDDSSAAEESIHGSSSTEESSYSSASEDQPLRDEVSASSSSALPDQLEVSFGQLDGNRIGSSYSSRATLATAEESSTDALEADGGSMAKRPPSDRLILSAIVVGSLAFVIIAAISARLVQRRFLQP